MSLFSCLIRFQSTDGSQTYFADLGSDLVKIPSAGSQLKAYTTFPNLLAKEHEVTATLGKLLAPLPYDGVPIYCVGLNYKSHAEEAKLDIPKCPPLWTKPAASLAHPNDDIPMNKFCAASFPDYEGELTFVTSRECRDLTPEQAPSYILGYTAGNDLSCRLYQMPGYSGGQFFFAKAFDNFAPLGPTLISPELMSDGDELKLTTKVNGELLQNVEFMTDLVLSPAQILSHMSQGTTIPAGTAVMTGTPSGVGAFQNPRRFLKDGDVVEVEISKIGVLSNKITFV